MFTKFFREVDKEQNKISHLFLDRRNVISHERVIVFSAGIHVFHIYRDMWRSAENE